MLDYKGVELQQVLDYTGVGLHRCGIRQVSDYNRCWITQVSDYTGVGLDRCRITQVPD